MVKQLVARCRRRDDTICPYLAVLLHLRHDVFFFNDTATTEIYTLSLHDALPIYHRRSGAQFVDDFLARLDDRHAGRDRKSTRLNSSHVSTSYAVFCLKKKRKLVMKSILETKAATILQFFAGLRGPLWLSFDEAIC